MPNKIKKKDLLDLCEAVMDSKIGLNKEAVYKGDKDIAYRACSIYREFGGKTAAYLAMADGMDKAKEKEYVEVEEDPDSYTVNLGGDGFTYLGEGVAPHAFGESGLSQAVITLSKAEVNSEAVCPKCGKSHYYAAGGTSTCAYYPPYVTKDGETIPNPDCNVTTARFRCLECGHEWEA